MPLRSRAMRGVSNHECTHLGLFLSLHLFISSSLHLFISSSLGISSHRPGRGVDGERRQAHSSSIVARARRDHRVPVRPGPLSALHRGDFRPGTHAAGSRQWDTGAAIDCPRQTCEDRQSGSGPSVLRFAPHPWDATPRSTFSGRGIIRERQRKHITRRDALEQRRRRARD